MKITRQIYGKEIEIALTEDEIKSAYEEHLNGVWLDSINAAIDRNADSIRFVDGYSRDDLVSDCMDEIESKWYESDWDERCDEVVFSMAESNDLWHDGDEEDDD